jgi:hypothetical protein
VGVGLQLGWLARQWPAAITRAVRMFRARLTADATGKEKRHEKIKLRGLSDYQKQIEICITEQKDTEMVLQILSILVKDTEIAQAHSKT